MNCKEILPLLSGHLDSTNSSHEERQLQQHLKSCKACRELLSAFAQNDRLLRSEPQRPPLDLSGRIMREVHRDAVSSRPSRWKILSFVASGVAAAALLCFIISGGFQELGHSADTKALLETDGAAGDEEKATAWNSGAFAADFQNFSDYFDSTYDILQNGNQQENIQNIPVASGSTDNSGRENMIGNTEAKQSDSSMGPTELAAAGDINAASSQLASEQDFGAAYPELTLPSADLPFNNALPSESSALSGKRQSKLSSPPVFVLWNADPTSISALNGLSFSTATDSAFGKPLSNSLATRMNTALRLKPELSTDFAAAQTYTISVQSCTVPYETISAILEECAGKYELCLYYPASLHDASSCTLLIVQLDETLSATPQEQCS